MQSNVDRLTCILRYDLDNSPISVEGFIKFLWMEGHSAQQLANNSYVFLEDCGIEVKNCRGQSYDNDGKWPENITVFNLSSGNAVLLHSTSSASAIHRIW